MIQKKIGSTIVTAESRTNSTAKKPQRGDAARQLTITQKKKTFLALYKKKRCNITKACTAAHVGRTTYYSWMETDKTFRAAVVAEEESLIDWAEDMLKSCMRTKDTTAIIFFLKTKGKERGYKQEIELGGAIKATIERIVTDERPEE